MREGHEGFDPLEKEKKEPSPDDLRKDPNWARLLDQGYRFVSQVARDSTNVKRHFRDHWPKKNIIEQLRDAGENVEVSDAYEFGNPSTERKMENMMAVFAKKKE